MIAPAANQLAEELGITSSALVAMTTSIFILGYGEYLLYVVPHPDFLIIFFPWIAVGPLVRSRRRLGPFKG